MEREAVFDLSYLPLKIVLRAEHYAELPPYLGSALRGVIGQSLYRTNRQAYDFLYANGKSQNGEKDILNPYMIVPPKPCHPKTVVRQGELLEFQMVLFGQASAYALSLVKALKNIGQYGLGAQRYPFYLEFIGNRCSNRAIWRNGQYYEAGICQEILSCRQLEQVAGAIIQLQTPLRIRRRGQLVTSVSFPAFMRNITKRIGAITERYGGWVNQTEIEKILVLAEHIQLVKEDLHLEHLERYSNRLQEKMDFSGLMGEIEFAGDITPFVPWLSAAEVLHIGRNTTFGMGQVEVLFL
ncbi:MAG: CRISPR system precrRNA processing endoribonuclease RAMP protein Cas6 [Lachnospiraceae bacterium]